jgi:tetratricopeptide (TPR) repeat protein
MFARTIEATARPRVAVAVAFALASTCCAAIARGETPAPDDAKPGDAALAEALFEKGKALMAERRFEEACPMLAESQRVDPGGGTALALALCHERQGKTATAWSELKDALALARRDGEADRRAVAERHLAALEPKLSRLTLRISRDVAATRGLAISRDGIALAPAAWGFAAPVDPGVHHVEARAPGKRAWAREFTVAGDGAVVEVAVPALVDAPAASDARPPERGTSARTFVGWSLVGAGAVAIAVGAVFGVRALTEQSSADATCPTRACNDSDALSANGSAQSAALVADVALPLGAATSAAGVIVLLTARHEPKPAVALAPFALGARGPALGVTLGAAF